MVYSYVDIHYFTFIFAMVYILVYIIKHYCDSTYLVYYLDMQYIIFPLYEGGEKSVFPSPGLNIRYIYILQYTVLYTEQRVNNC